MTIFPQIKVEIAFQNDPYATSPTWTDVTKYVRGNVTVQRGRNYELNKNESGNARLVLENTDGRFDPLNTASPYAPYLLPYRQIRVTAIGDVFGTTYPIFRGYVKQWPQTWSESGNYGTVSISAVDGMKTSLSKKFGLRYFEQVGVDKAQWYFRFASSSVTANSGLASSPTSTTGAPASTADGNVAVTYVAGVGPSGADDVVRHAWTALSSKPDDTTGGGTQTFVGNTSGGPYGSSTDGDVVVDEVWWKPETVPATSSTHFLRVMGLHRNTNVNGLPNAQVDCYFDPAGAYWKVLVDNNSSPAGVGFSATSTLSPPSAGKWHHVALRVTKVSSTTRTYELYVNGTRIINYTQTATGNFGAFGCGGLGGAYVLPAGFACQWAESATYSSTTGSTSAGSILNRATYQSTYAEFGVQTTGARVSSLLDAIGWPSSLRSVETGASTVQATGSLSGKTALDVLQAAAGDELGNVFIDGQGRVVFHNRAHRNSPASVCTFGEGAGEVPYLEGVTVDFDDVYISNRVEVTQSGVTPTYVATSFDATSQTTYGLRVLPVSTTVSASADADGQAATLLARYKQPVARLGILPVDIKANPSAIAKTLSREIGDLATVKRRPVGAPAISLDVFIDGIEDNISATSWVRSFLTTPKFANATY